MRTTHLILLVGIFAFTACQQLTEPVALSEADRAAIAASTKTFVEGVNAKDWAGVAALYTEDAMIMPPNGPTAKGRANVQAFLEAFPPLSAFNLVNAEVEGLGDMAYVRGAYTMTITPEGADPVTDTGKFIEIRKKQADGSWLLYLDIFNSDVPLSH